MNKVKGGLRLTGAAVVALAMVGCSTISDSISDSISSPFKWSSKSSKSSSDDESSYQRDVRDYMAAYVRSGNDLEGFTRGLTALAGRYGISDWEADASTYTGVGEGLAQAKADQSQVELFKSRLAGADVVKAAAIQKGYDRYKKA